MIVLKFVEAAMQQVGYCSLRHQQKLYQTQFEGSQYVDVNILTQAYTYDNNPRLEYFKNDEILGQLTLKDMSGRDLA